MGTLSYEPLLSLNQGEEAINSRQTATKWPAPSLPNSHRWSSRNNYCFRRARENDPGLVSRILTSGPKSSHDKCIDSHGTIPSIENLFMLLQSCVAEKHLALGKEAHHLIAASGLDSNHVLGTQIIQMYAFFNSLQEANHAFLKVHEPNVYAWTAIISACAEMGMGGQAIELYIQMLDSSVAPDGHAFVAVLKACAVATNMVQGKQTHAHIVENGLDLNAFVSCTLIDMYSKCGSLHDAQVAFARFGLPNKVTWNALIAGYVEHGCGNEALNIFQHMQYAGMEVDRVTFLCILKACSNAMALAQGKQIHCHIIESGFDRFTSVSNTLIDMYIKCGSLEDAHSVFGALPQQNVVAWTSLIAGYGKHGQVQRALELFQQMQHKGIQPNEVTFLCLISACSDIAALDKGRDIHVYIIESGHESHECVSSAVIDMYAKCGEFIDAQVVFSRLGMQNTASWNSLIGGYAQHGRTQEALWCFDKMQQCMEPDKVTFSCILNACSSIQYLDHGKEAHAIVIIRGLETDIFVGNTLIDMYVKCESLQNAQVVFDKLHERDVITWTTLIMGYVQQGYCQEALNFFHEMQHEGVEPNQVTFVIVLKACSSLAALEHSKLIQCAIAKNGWEADVCIGSALIDTYAKCGSLEDAHIVFNRLPFQDVVTWSALMGGHAYHSDYKSTLEYFEAMQQTGLWPDEVTLLCLLSACSHAGLVDEGCRCLKMLVAVYGNLLAVEHYNCIVDLFGHAGYLHVAEDLLETVPFEYNVVGWNSLLSSCRTSGNVMVGKRCFHWVLQVEPANTAIFVLMSSIYSNAGLWEEADSLDEMRKCATLWNKPAESFIEVDNQLHNFTVGDKTHALNDRIHAKLNTLRVQLKEESHYQGISISATM